MRAFSQSRCTVRSVRPCIAAISTNEKPQKNFRSTTSARRGSTAPNSSRAVLSASSSATGARGDVDAGLERGDLEEAAALLGPPPARVIDDERAHHPRRVAHEPRPIRERRAGAPGHVEIRLVQQGGRAERQLAALPGQLPAGELVQLAIEASNRASAAAGSPLSIDAMSSPMVRSMSPEGPPAYRKVAAPMSGSAGRLRSFE